MRILKEGQKVRDTYVVERFLGEGAFAEVYRVQHNFLGRQAMKVFKAPGLTENEVRNWLDEAVLLSKIGHPNIIRVFDANTFTTKHGTYGYFTMEYVAGGSLDRFWQSHKNRFMPIDVAIDVFQQACRGIAIAHAEIPPVVHRDIKPQNILVGYDKSGLLIRISDFGLAKSVNPLTLLASAKGTLLFKSPEALEDFQRDSAAGDVWALGVSLYLILTDRIPYLPQKGESIEDLKRFRHLLEPASKFNYQVNSRLDTILAKALECNPERRYPNALMLMKDLEELTVSPEKEPAMRSRPDLIDESKGALGLHTPADEQKARQKALKAIEIGKQASKLQEAADLLEEAINAWPLLREEFGYLLTIWRKGLLM